MMDQLRSVKYVEVISKTVLTDGVIPPWFKTVIIEDKMLEDGYEFKLVNTYVYDANAITYLCNSQEPYYWCKLVSTKDNSGVQIIDNTTVNDDLDGDYYDCSFIDSLESATILTPILTVSEAELINKRSSDEYLKAFNEAIKLVIEGIFNDR